MLHGLLTHWDWDKITENYQTIPFKCTFLNEHVSISNTIWPKFVPKGQTDIGSDNGLVHRMLETITILHMESTLPHSSQDWDVFISFSVFQIPWPQSNHPQDYAIVRGNRKIYKQKMVVLMVETQYNWVQMGNIPCYQTEGEAWGMGTHSLIRTVCWPRASYQIRKIACCACAGNAGNIFPATDFKGYH